MLEAFGWGFLAQSSLLVAGLLVCWVTVPTRLVGILGGFGAGAMIAAVSFDLLPEAEQHIEPWQTGVWMLVGVAVFLLADAFVEPAGDRSLGRPRGKRLGPEAPWPALVLVVLACGIAAALGFLATDVSGAIQGDRAAALAAGGLLAMLTNSLMPFSFERGGSLAGAATALGFCLSVLNS